MKVNSTLIKYVKNMDGSLIGVGIKDLDIIHAIDKKKKITMCDLLNTKNDIFTLKVSGESMINVGIYDGDILIVERTNTAKNGDTVVAMNTDNEVTVKTFYKENGYFRLQPENDYMEPIILKEVTIIGKAIGLYRKF